MHPQDGNAGRSAARASGSRRHTMRVVKDTDGGMVLVYEADPATPAGSRTLVFESGTGRHRLDQYPSDWRRMGDRELLSLFEH